MAIFEGAGMLLSASDYVQHILKYGEVSEYCFLVAIVYLDRLKHQEHSICLTSRTLHRLLLVAVLTAAKFLDDDTFPMTFPNKWW